MLCPHRLTIITGHYGTGKTEFAVNLALHLAAQGGSVSLADLDIVNPYFRSRERKELLREHGISLIASSQACTDADVPAL
ncbi:MAG: P-loop NTPase, partial [Oscillibacter sp.]|nr:P-loop NTPase [Oscillibacter sp.]